MIRPHVAPPAADASTPTPRDVRDPDGQPASLDQRSPLTEDELTSGSVHSSPDAADDAADAPDPLAAHIPHPSHNSDGSTASDISQDPHVSGETTVGLSASAVPAQSTAPDLRASAELVAIPDQYASAALSAPLAVSGAATLNASRLNAPSPGLIALPGGPTSPTLSASPYPHDAYPHNPGHSDLLPPRNAPDRRTSRVSREPQTAYGQSTRAAVQTRVQTPRAPQPRTGVPRGSGGGSTGNVRTYSNSGTGTSRTYSANPPRNHGTGYGYRANVPLPYRSPSAGANNLGPLTGLGVSLMLGAVCAAGALFDMLLVGGPAWALAVMYIAACAYTAARVRRADWFSALVSPPLAFAAAVIMLATLMPSSFGPGTLGVIATTFTLLAAKAKALYIGNAISAGVLLSRRIKARRAIPKPRPAS